MKKFGVILIVLSFFLITGVAVAYKTFSVPVVPVHFHANFLVVKDGFAQDFSGPEFMHIQPCTPDQKETGDTIHMHDGDGDVVHVHGAGAVWRDLAEHLHLEIPDDATVVLNGEKRDQKILDEEIHAGDKLLISFGKTDKTTEELYGWVPADSFDYEQGGAKAGVESCGSDLNKERSLLDRFRIAFGL